MPRKKIGVQSALTPTNKDLAEKLAEELKSDRDYGQPLVYEQEYSTKRTRVTVMWDKWADVPLEDRSAVILRAYELAEGKPAREKIALASGLTVPEATAAGLLPYQVIPALRESDTIKPEDVKQAMIEQGASQLSDEDGLQLRFATREEADACRKRLAEALPATRTDLDYQPRHPRSRLLDCNRLSQRGDGVTLIREHLLRGSRIDLCFQRLRSPGHMLRSSRWRPTRSMFTRRSQNDDGR